MNTYQNELNVAIKAIKQASKVVMEIYHGDFAINIKKDNSEVTIADTSSEKIIKELLLYSFPNYAILSEESEDNLNRLNNDYCWIVDPLDGTKDFVNKTNNFSINIALAYKNEIVLGVIAVPFYDKIYYATKGNGAYKIQENNTSKIHVSNNKNNLFLLTSKFFFDPNSELLKDKLISKVQSIGSSYKAGLIAEGYADLCIKYDANSKEWDTAPSEIIISEAGGYMCDLFGQKRLYNKKDVYNHTGFIIANCKEVVDIFKK